MSESTLSIAPPDPGKPPLRVNAFNHAQKANTALCPLFPYLGDGDMVPATTLMYGGKGRESGVFNHFNTVDETFLIFGSEGAVARTGDAFAGGQEHIVRSGFEDPENPDSLILAVVTQRQADPGERQHEFVSYQCEKCQNVLMMHAFEAQEEPREDAPPGYVPPFLTVTEPVAAWDAFNADETRRTCGKCGHLNPKFPIDVWGWRNYRNMQSAAERARSIYFKSVHAAGEA